MGYCVFHSTSIGSSYSILLATHCCCAVGNFPWDWVACWRRCFLILFASWASHELLEPSSYIFDNPSQVCSRMIKNTSHMLRIPTAPLFSFTWLFASSLDCVWTDHRQAANYLRLFSPPLPHLSYPLLGDQYLPVLHPFKHSRDRE